MLHANRADCIERTHRGETGRSFADSRRTGSQSLSCASRRQIGVDSGRGRNHRALDPRYPVARKIGHVGAAPRRTRACGIASFRARCTKSHRVEALYEDLGIKASKDLKRQPLTADSSDSQALPRRMAKLRWPVHSRHDSRTRQSDVSPLSRDAGKSARLERNIPGKEFSYRPEIFAQPPGALRPIVSARPRL
jgi:hypothetical protein